MIDWSREINSAQALKHRQVKHFGYEFRYDNNRVDASKPLSSKIPPVCSVIFQKLSERYANPCIPSTAPDQLTVNKYEPGQGRISLRFWLRSTDRTICHRNPAARRHPQRISGPNRRFIGGWRRCHGLDQARRRWIRGVKAGISAGSETIADDNERRKSIRLDARNHPKKTRHRSERRRAFDVQKPDDSHLIHFSMVFEMNFDSNRHLITSFYRLKHDPCACSYPSLCDSQKDKCKTESSDSRIEAPSDLEQQNVHKVYNEIANHFSETRHSPWPQVEEFVCSFAPGSVLVDIGCGNGKYLSLNSNIAKVLTLKPIIVSEFLERCFLPFSDWLRSERRSAEGLPRASISSLPVRLSRSSAALALGRWSDKHRRYPPLGLGRASIASSEGNSARLATSRASVDIRVGEEPSSEDHVELPTAK